jgi:hypothetical protein
MTVKFDGSQAARALNPAVVQYGGLNQSQLRESSHRLVLCCVLHQTMHCCLEVKQVTRPLTAAFTRFHTHLGRLHRR